MISPTPDSWPVYALGYRFCVLSIGKKSSFVDQERFDWCNAFLGDMNQGGWCDQGAYMCFKDRDHAALYDMTWNYHG